MVSWGINIRWENIELLCWERKKRAFPLLSQLFLANSSFQQEVKGTILCNCEYKFKHRLGGSSTTSKSTSTTSAHRCRRCRQTDVDDVDFGIVEISIERSCHRGIRVSFVSSSRLKRKKNAPKGCFLRKKC